MITFKTELLKIARINHASIANHALFNNGHMVIRGTLKECETEAKLKYEKYIDYSKYFQTLAKELEEKGEVIFNHAKDTYSIWETEQGDENSRGEEFMNYMISVYTTEDYNEANDIGVDPIEFTGGLCEGTPKDAITFMIQDSTVYLKCEETGEVIALNQEKRTFKMITKATGETK